MARILTTNGSSHSETSLTRETRLTSSEIRDIERGLQRLNVIQALTIFQLPIIHSVCQILRNLLS